MRKSFCLESCLLASSICVSAGNLLPWDASFETGSARFKGGSVVSEETAERHNHVLELRDTYNHSPILYDVVRKGNSYVLSFKARSVGGPVTLHAAVAHVLYGNLAGRSCDLTEEWRTFEVPIPAPERNHDIYLTFYLPENRRARIDDLMLNSGTAAEPFRPAAPYLLQIDRTGYAGNIVYEGDSLPSLNIGVLREVAGEGRQEIEPFRGTLRIRTEDFYGAEVRAEEISIVLDAENPVVRYAYSAPAGDVLKNGYYLVTATLTEDATGKVAASDAMPFGVVPEPLKIPAERSFFGVHPDSTRVANEALARIGAKWVRYMPLWGYLEKTPGEYDFRFGDLEELGKYNLAVYFSLRILEQAPQAYVGPDGKIRDVEALRRFLHALGRSVPENVRAWEIENEPDQTYPSRLKSDRVEAAKYYGEVVALASAFFKEVRPDLPVGAMPVSGGAGDSAFVTQAEKSADGAQIDLFAPHPYTGSRYIGPRLKSVPADFYIRKHLMDRAKLTGGRPLWAGEVGWSYDRREKLDSATYRTYSNYVARALILIRSVKEVERVMWFKAQGCYERDFFQYGLWREEYEPLAATVFYANLAQLLEEATPLEPIYEADLRVYPFRRHDGRVFCLVWRGGGDISELRIGKIAGDIAGFDLFGKRLALTEEENEVVIPLSETPIRLECDTDGNDGTELLESIKAARIAVTPFTVSFFSDTGNRLAGTFRNNLPTRQEVTISAPGAKAWRTKLAPGMLKSLVVNWETDDARPAGEIPVTFTSDAGTMTVVFDPETLESCGKRPAAGAAEAVPRHLLGERRFIYPPDPGIDWKSAQDLSAEYALSYDEKCLYLDVDVTDPVHTPSSAKYRKWHADSLQLAVDSLNDGRENVFEYNENDVEFIAWLDDEGPHLEKTWSLANDIGMPVPESKVEITRDDAKHLTRYRIALPWSQLGKLAPEPGRFFRFNFIVNQNNGTGRNYWLGVTEGIGEMKYPFLYKVFQLK